MSYTEPWTETTYFVTKRYPCPKCGGTGYTRIGDEEMTHNYTGACTRCDNEGWVEKRVDLAEALLDLQTQEKRRHGN